ncbi:MAG TPA: lytic transglycosylase domain-containing protein [Noviherbaspirillum sp.]|uniref:lytic transglycosylase domain-containing protein n=1 Tax=Noviherbaspirillum sp. TaxID=1926288 RepID=UPI002D24C7B0|nr:lytic transglycosylase domain-containing protein [Noviherbaspirillum sp.]HYD94177.1 lytic transglycosylase domain-containing protein [Noviherbaspirillum sp.]
MCGKPACATGFVVALTSCAAAGARAVRSGAKTALLACGVAVLAACAGPFPVTAPGGDNTQQAASLPLNSEASRPRRTRATRPQDVLSEWGTFGIEPRSFKKPKTTRARPLIPAPEYTESIQEIVDNATCHSCEQKPYHRLVVNASIAHGVPPSLIHAVIQKESGYNPNARSHRNARGLMQVTPATARFVGVGAGKSLYDPQTNINAGTAYLKYLMRTHDTFEEVLAAYNSGPGNVRKYNGVPPFRETRRYVIDVKRYYAASAKEGPAAR